MSVVLQRLTELGLSLPAAPAALGAYIPVVVTGPWAITAGQIPMRDGKLLHPGAVGGAAGWTGRFLNYAVASGRSATRARPE